jgi:hypothetical protein
MGWNYTRFFYLFYFDRQEQNSEQRKNIFIHVSFLFTVTSIKVYCLTKREKKILLSLILMYVISWMIVWNIVNASMYRRKQNSNIQLELKSIYFFSWHNGSNSFSYSSFFRSFGYECSILRWSFLFVCYNTLHGNHIQPLQCQQKKTREELKELFIQRVFW